MVPHSEAFIKCCVNYCNNLQQAYYSLTLLPPHPPTPLNMSHTCLNFFWASAVNVVCVYGHFAGMEAVKPHIECSMFCL